MMSTNVSHAGEVRNFSFKMIGGTSLLTVKALESF